MGSLTKLKDFFKNRVKMTNGNDERKKVLMILLGVVTGAIGLYILKRALDAAPPPCPGCGHPLHEEVNSCSNCHKKLEWVD